MSDSIKTAIWQACDLLVTEKQIITAKNIKVKLQQQGYSWQDIEHMEPDISTLINKWRIEKLHQEHLNIQPNKDFNLYKTLGLPKQDDKSTINKLQKQIFNLEFELNKYKHTAFRVGKRNKLLEKKIHALILNTKRERQEFIDQIQEMLT